jgi:hypothetical protein
MNQMEKGDISAGFVAHGRVSVGKPEGKRPLLNININEWIILKWILKN